MFRQKTQPAIRESTPRLGSRDLGVAHYFERYEKSDKTLSHRERERILEFLPHYPILDSPESQGLSWWRCDVA